MVRSYYDSVTDPHYNVIILHDDYDDSNWSIRLYSEYSDEDLAAIDNLDQLTAMEVFNKIVKLNDKTMYFSNEYGETTFEDYLEYNPVIKSEKLKKIRQFGMFD